ncbi:hypothetical protein Q31b_35890 [Novipirellula aureliae]|uniref:Phage portal protein, lambda family n=1 Tax=Novipirellula aureliae TaxID=2527966 RepID=A0A5C6DVC9_9BACT|nr:hypothetical protein [Novipirellula aureliae]TWU40244.1 hypothetical protein Q31b_35890 [Novipirellula aureliae]
MLKRLSGIIEHAWRGGASRSSSASGRSTRQPFFSRLRAKYDAANTTLDNMKHWSRADGLSAAAANSPDVRRTLRNRSRYEVANNSYLPNSLRTLDSTFEHQWFWDGHEHVDPAKEANAQKIRLSNHTTTLAIEFARQGRDWETELKQRAKELELMHQLGLSLDSNFVDTDVHEDKDDHDDQEQTVQQAT